MERDKVVHVVGSAKLGWGFMSMAGKDLLVEQAAPGQYVDEQFAIAAGVRAFAKCGMLGLVEIVYAGTERVVRAFLVLKEDGGFCLSIEPTLDSIVFRDAALVC